MSTQTNQRFVLDLLETGKIDPGEAEWLLETISDQPLRTTATPHSPASNNQIILEIDADQENLENVIKKLNQAICPDAARNQRPWFLQRLTRRRASKTAVQ
ncbi:MAG: hypothetical protein JW757_02120 [Anaerolineales bacterium]|nr:hypothetical protein [Anaerolineales bacterium]